MCMCACIFCMFTNSPVNELLKAVLSCVVVVWQCVCLSTHCTPITIHSAAIERKHTMCVRVLF